MTELAVIEYLIFGCHFWISDRSALDDQCQSKSQNQTVSGAKLLGKRVADEMQGMLPSPIILQELAYHL